MPRIRNLSAYANSWIRWLLRAPHAPSPPFLSMSEVKGRASHLLICGDRWYDGQLSSWTGSPPTKILSRQLQWHMVWICTQHGLQGCGYEHHLSISYSSRPFLPVYDMPLAPLTDHRVFQKHPTESSTQRSSISTQTWRPQSTTLMTIYQGPGQTDLVKSSPQHPFVLPIRSFAILLPSPQTEFRMADLMAMR